MMNIFIDDPFILLHLENIYCDNGEEIIHHEDILWNHLDIERRSVASYIHWVLVDASLWYEREGIPPSDEPM